MKELWDRTFELFRRHIVLWVPCSIAGILMIGLVRLEKAEIHWLKRVFGTQHSVLGGDGLSADMAQAQHRAMLALYPIGLLKYFLEICVCVVALAATTNLVRMVLNDQRPALTDAVRSVLPRSREVLLFTLKYMAGLAVFGGALMLLSSSPLISDRLQEVFFFKTFVIAFGLAGQACLAWFLLPAAIRLLRKPGAPIISTDGRKVGTVFSVVSSACIFLLERLVDKAESSLVFEKLWEPYALGVLNTVVINMPQVLLFIAISLLALQEPGQEESIATETEIV